MSGPSPALGRPHQRNRRVSLYGGALREDKENRSRRSSTSARSVFAKHFPIVERVDRLDSAVSADHEIGMRGVERALAGVGLASPAPR